MRPCSSTTLTRGLRQKARRKRRAIRAQLSRRPDPTARRRRRCRPIGGVASLPSKEQAAVTEGLGKSGASGSASRAGHRVGAANPGVGVPMGDQMCPAGKQPIDSGAEDFAQCSSAKSTTAASPALGKLPGFRSADPALHIGSAEGPALEGHEGIAAALDPVGHRGVPGQIQPVRPGGVEGDLDRQAHGQVVQAFAGCRSVERGRRRWCRRSAHRWRR